MPLPPPGALPLLRLPRPLLLIHIHPQPCAAALLINIVENYHDLVMVTPFTGNAYMVLLAGPATLRNCPGSGVRLPAGQNGNHEFYRLLLPRRRHPPV